MDNDLSRNILVVSASNPLEIKGADRPNTISKETTTQGSSTLHNINISDIERQRSSISSGYQMPWLTTYDPTVPYIIDPHQEKISSESISSGPYSHINQYQFNSNRDLYPYMMSGGSSMIPLEGYGCNTLSNFEKIEQNSSNSNNELNSTNESHQNTFKSSSTTANPHHELSCGLTSEALGGPNTIFCVYCHKNFKDNTALSDHVVSEHPEHAQMSSYLDSNINQSQYPTCPSCNSVLTKIGPYESAYSLSDNINEDSSLNITHGNSLLMMCEQCCKEYTLTLAPESQVSSSQYDSNRRFYCQHCHRSYKHNRDLLKHLRSMHGIDTSIERGQSSSYTLGATTHPPTTTTSGQPPTTKLTCPVCSKNFRGPFELKRHNQTVHENKRPYNCNECNKSFRDAYELKRHSASHARLRYHTGPQNVHLNQAGNINRMRGLDSGNPTSDPNNSDIISQTIMGSQYPVPSSAQSFSHTVGSTDYFCHVCDKNFRGANEFKRHYSVVHEKKFRYKCIHCDKLWRDQYDLKRHCLRSHKMDKDIDRSFIRQCLLDNNNDSVLTLQPNLGIQPYDMSDNPLNLNQSVSDALYCDNNRNSATGIDTFSLLPNSDIITSNQQVNFFANLSSLPNSSMLYHPTTTTNSYLVNDLVQNNETSNIDESKDVSAWNNTFETEFQKTPPPYLRSPK